MIQKYGGHTIMTQRKKKNYSKTPVTVKRTDEMEEMLVYLEDKWLLNSSAVLRYCLARVYEEEIKKEEVLK